MDEELKSLLIAACEAFQALTPEEQEEHRRQQRRSFAWGNLECSTNHRVPREDFDRYMDEYEKEEEQARVSATLSERRKRNGG
jgi:hypothetical protein